ncbi:MAG: acyl carrier protein [Pleurocapsa minor HA4230-MV1]|jgi:acyl carrier protein|nr:acyl carrier protein [Pleurocapsa minor HA4230-MV1]
MSIENQNYQFEILEYAVNQHLDKLLSCSDKKDALNVILNQSKDLIWKIATEIYNESGHKIDFAFIKNLLDQRSNLLENRIGEEQKAKADLEARRLFKKAEKERFREEQRVASIKATAKLKDQKIEQIAKQKELDRERRERESKQLQAFKQANSEINSNYESSDIFIRIGNTIADQLEINQKTIKFNSYIMKDLGADELDNIEIVMAIEEEFDIEITDDDIPSCKSIKVSPYDYSCSSYEDWNIEKMFYLVVQKI